MENMIFQGTVWGAPLWNAFYSDTAVPVRNCGFTESVFADDLNAFKVLLQNMYTCENQKMFWADVHVMLYIIIFDEAAA